MSENRPDPNKLLKEINEEEQRKNRGKLKIFFGYAAGVGKTYAMLQSAHTAMEEGMDVVAGYIEPHARPETMALLNGLEVLPVREISYRNIVLREFDLDRAVSRKPQLILVDELAHTNAQGCRHRKRYQDIQELLKHGINVYTTVNVQHLESLADIVASITGVMVKERIPDFIFDNANQVELVDIEPEELQERLKEGKIYRKNQAGSAMDHFFQADNLTALREIALRRTADHVNQTTEKSRERNPDSEYYTDEHIMVCLSPSPSSAKVIRAAARMAKAFKARFTAAHVEEPGAERLGDEDAMRLRMNQRLAEQLGAKTVVLYGGDITRQIAEYARVSGVSKIVLGRSYNKRSPFTRQVSFSDQLSRLLPKTEIYLIPDTYENRYAKKYVRRREREDRKKTMLRDVGATAVILIGVTAISLLFGYWKFDEANIITLYILGILMNALVTESQVFNILASVLSVACFNFFFTNPRWTLLVDKPGYIVTFGIMFLAGFITAFLAKKVKIFGRQAAKRAWRMETLLETSQKLQIAKDSVQIAEVMGRQLVKLLDRDIIYYGGDPEIETEVLRFPKEEDSQIELLLSQDEVAVAVWCYRNNKHAGAMTNTLPGAKGLYLAVRSGERVFGVVGICMGEKYMSAFDESLMNAILNEAAMALERDYVSKEKLQADMKMKQEQLRANLLRSISHDLRTPLTSISGNSGILLEQELNLSGEQKHKLYEGIYDDSVWLYNLVENLLSVTRIENGNMQLNLQPELLEDVIQEALTHIKRRTQGHVIRIDLQDEFLMAWMDAKLIMQVILNIVDNALKYTSEGTSIVISAKKRLGRILVEIADNGEGILDASKERIFDMFYAENKTLADSRRSMGVGLALCRSIVAAHGGKLTVRDNIPKGSIFAFDLREEEVEGIGSEA